MKYRILTIVTIGFVCGILWELYKLEMALFFCIFLGLVIVISWTLKRRQEKRAIRYQKWMRKQISYKMLLIGIIALGIGVIYTGICKQDYEKVFALENQKLSLQGIILSDKQEEEYKDVYTIQIETIGKSSSLKGKKVILNVKKQKHGNILLQYGDRVCITGEILPPEKQRNENGFQDIEYLRSRGYIGRMQVRPDAISILEQDCIHGIAKIANTIKQALTKSITKLLPEKTRGLCLGILLGDKEQISQECIQDFQGSSLSHMLAVSGDHVNYLIMGVSLLLYKMKCNNRGASFLAILVLILFMYMTGFTPSVARACIMGILALGAKIGYQKYDWINSFSISILLLTIGNPFVLQDVGFLLSYGGVLGIICFFPILETEIQKRKEARQEKRSHSQTTEVTLVVVREETKARKIGKMVLENIQTIVGISISANIVLIPILMLTFQTVSFTFWISNILAGGIMGILVLMGFSFSILGMLVGPTMQKLLGFLLNAFLELLMGIAKFCAQIPFSRVYVIPPSLGIILVYYMAIFLFWGYYHLKEKKSKRILEEWILLQLQHEKVKWKYRCKKYKKYILLVRCSMFSILPGTAISS